jgi:hypothetical protein
MTNKLPDAYEDLLVFDKRENIRECYNKIISDSNFLKDFGKLQPDGTYTLDGSVPRFREWYISINKNPPLDDRAWYDNIGLGSEFNTCFNGSLYLKKAPDTGYRQQ